MLLCHRFIDEAEFFGFVYFLVESTPLHEVNFFHFGLPVNSLCGPRDPAGHKWILLVVQPIANFAVSDPLVEPILCLHCVKGQCRFLEAV